VFLIILVAYTLPFDSPIMTNIEYLQVKKFFDIQSIKPYQFSEIVSQIDSLLMGEFEFNETDKKVIVYFNPYLTKSTDFSTLLNLKVEYQMTPPLYYNFCDARLAGRLNNNIAYSQAVRFRFATKVDTLGPHPWIDTIGESNQLCFQAYLNEGLVKLNFDNIKFDIGRRNFLFGPGDEHSLTLSLDSQGYDGYLILIPSKYYEFFTIFAILDATQNRYLTVHRLGLNLKQFKLGFSEANLFGGSLEPLYLNFFLPYYLAQWGMNRDDNIMWCFDLTFRLFNSIVYSEFLVDDFQWESDPYPNKLAYQWGIKSLVLDRILIKTNYTLVDKWVYTQRFRINNYERKGHPLGFPLGNDVDKFSASFIFFSQPGLSPNMSISYTRKGEGSISLPYEEEGGPINPPFPSGIVEKNLEVKLGIDYTPKPKFYIKIEVGRRLWRNNNHIPNNDVNETLCNIGIWMIF